LLQNFINMRLICKSEIINADEIVSSSKMIQDIISDCYNDGDSDEPIPIPDEYYSALTDNIIQPPEVLLRSIHILEIIKSIPNDYVGTYKANIIINGVTSYIASIIHMNGTAASERIYNLEAMILKEINRLLSFLKLYNFLNIKPGYLNVLAYIIGQVLEESGIRIDIAPELLTLIVTNYPSLYLDSYHKDVWLPQILADDIESNPIKYESVYYHKKYNQDISLDRYKEANNNDVLMYYTLIKGFENRSGANSCEKTVCIYTINNPVIDAFRDLVTGVNSLISS
jgi:hypothetical protein